MKTVYCRPCFSSESLLAVANTMWSSIRSEPTFLLPGRNGSGVAESDSFLLGDGNPEVRKLFRNACKVGFSVSSGSRRGHSAVSDWLSQKAVC